jgi:plastocyanin
MMASPEGTTTTTTTSKQQQPQTAGPIAGATTVSILQGASTQGNPNYDPSDGKVPLGNKVVWQNKDTVPHTATSGTGPSDSSSGKMFDTKIINPAASSDPQVLNGVKQGDVVSYYCQIHPYMTAKLTVTAASAGGGGGNATKTTAGGGVSLSILQGASTQGNPAYSPNPLTVKKGDSISVVNKDAVPHTVTNGKDPSDPNSAKLFDTSIINAGQSAQITTTKLSAGQQYPFHCTVHPYMTGTLKVS